MLLDILIIVVLILCNGLLSMSELAVVSSRPARLKVMANDGNHGAAVALRLAEDPGKFLSSAQVGISLIGDSVGRILRRNARRAVYRHGLRRQGWATAPPRPWASARSLCWSPMYR